MALALAAVAEQLAYDFHELRYSTVVRVLTQCVDEYPNDGPLFIEQVAKARLGLLVRSAAETVLPEQRCPGASPA